ncbi:MAG TPA: NADP-dependent oxidoreductase [Pseudonocardiaceae bacterium]|jgi:NADPH:quinone reductase-like Zn-dependent oxidoreductase|nr:NADP-dependent oxidoreductase [Pseudonocardiaceae bacterium]
MKAVVLDSFGGPELLHEAEVDKPAPGPGQVLLAVKRAGVNPFDSKVRAGAMEAVFHTELPAVLGLEVAGVVEALGEGVTEVKVGDEVLGWSETGAYAEYVLATRILPKPAGLDWDVAAALPVAAETALRVLRLLAVASGETLLIHGASGAVGAMAVQLAVARGVTVIGTASAGNQAYVTSLGATATTYGSGLVERVRSLAPNGIDAVFDAAGRGALPDSIELRGGTERIVTIADPTAQSLGIAFSSGTAADASIPELIAVADQVASGKIVAAVAQAYPLAEAARAHEAIDSGHASGKLVLTVS